MLGGGGLVAANVYATASEGGSQQTGQSRNDQALAAGAATIDCPDVGSQLTAVPEQAKTEVDRELALLDKQIAEAYQRLQSSAKAIQQDSAFAENSIMNPLKDKRAATIERISIAIDRVGDRPQGLEPFAACILRASGNEGDGQNGDQGGDGQDQGGADQGDQNQGDGQGDGQDQGNDQGQDNGQGNGQGGNGGQAGNGPAAADFVDITKVQPNVQNAQKQRGASRGTFSTDCGVNAEGLFNSDNVIVAPGVSNGAHHFHDYVGNQSNDAFASDEDLAEAETSCENPGDKSSYFWPVIRLQNGAQEQDANQPGGGIEGNAGEIVTPKQVTMTFAGNARSKVTEMPKLLRIITGDAKAFVNGTANANASWSCTGFENKVQLKDKYPLCPKGKDVVRTFKFQSCWDGRNIDSANHRTHVAFADANGNCGNGFKAIPQLVQRIVYDVDAPSLNDGGRTTPLFAVDSFPEQLHKPVTDHGDFINVFDEGLMKDMVNCINSGRTCDAADETGEQPGNEQPGGEEPGNSPSPTASAPSGGDNDDPADNGNGGGNGGENSPSPTASAPSGGNNQDDEPADNGDENTAKPSTDSTQAPNPAEGSDQGNDQAVPRTVSSPSAARTAPAAGSAGGSGSDLAGAVPGPEPSASSQPEAQAIGGGLADTGTQLWPAAAGALLVLAGFVLLRRISARQR